MRTSRRTSPGFLCLWLLGSLLFATIRAPMASAQQKKPPAGTAAKGKEKDQAANLALEKALLQETGKAARTYLKDLGGIVSWAVQKGLKADAEQLLARMSRIDPEYPGLPKLKEVVAKAEAGAAGKETDDARKTLSLKVESAGDRYAARLFDLAKRCMQFGLFTRAYELIRDVLDANPDHKEARRILSYVWDPQSKTWITRWEFDMRKTSYLTPEGWVKKSDKAKWDKGLRPYKGKWVSKEEEKRIRTRNNYEPYEVETEHFVVKSNLGREKALEFAQRLEDFYRVFFDFFIGFHDQIASAKLLFNLGQARKKHEVQLFPSRTEYLDFVRQEKGNDELLVRSAGFWSSMDRRSFFFWTDNPGETINTLYHETTHQLLGETKEGATGSPGNVWLVEGIANYMELWQEVDGKWRPGYRIDAPSMEVVQGVLEKSPNWTLGGYIAQSHKEFHDPKGRALNYSLGGALSHFFLHYEDGIYREDFIKLLRHYYEGKLREDSLPRYIRMEGVDSSQEKMMALQKQFREYMKNLKRPGAGAEAESAPEEPATKGDPES